MSKCKLFSMIDKAIFEYKLIEEGDKILVNTEATLHCAWLTEFSQ